MNPWMLANEHAMYELGGAWRRHIEWVWSVDARTVPDDWSPDLAARADSAAAIGEQREYYNWVWDAYDYDRSWG